MPLGERPAERICKFQPRRSRPPRKTRANWLETRHMHPGHGLAPRPAFGKRIARKKMPVFCSTEGFHQSFYANRIVRGIIWRVRTAYAARQFYCQDGGANEGLRHDSADEYRTR